MCITGYVLKTYYWTSKIKNLRKEKNTKKFIWKRIVVEKIVNESLSRTRESYWRQR